ncbi:uncharacterized protein BDZ99DRAFT_460191 [Mytilinidion resinicola]|uniref:Helicase C-terminal domain-containing protein n=1 Tax=Mytilinidion resinicola TaxID=574789 RepID=A0A6A6YW99_9PEZI|nr:uncharacterized protein BDZ99DRAFT_460191 [Mytilinidion resinicola]KAF2812828.1 hypothetical protein BDZ99DRAFT_460191 [Mytilinidion resinicola]
MVKIEQTRRHKELVEEWRDNGALGPKPEAPNVANSASYTNAKTAATIAELVEHWEGISKNLSCTIRDPIVQGWIRNPLSGDFTTLLDRLTANCAKLAETLKLCEKVQQEKRLDGTRAKITIATRSPLALACWYNRLVQKYDSKQILLYKAGATPNERKKLQSDFDDDESKWVMMCTLHSVMTSINLQRANYNLMVEPSHKMSEIQQYFHRSDRRGQTEKIVHGYLLINSCSSLERRMLRSMDFSELLDEQVYKVKDGVKSKGRGTKYDAIVIT